MLNHAPLNYYLMFVYFKFTYHFQKGLINMGYSAVAIGERVGHESVEITYRYAHLFPTIQTEMAENLNQEREEYLDE